MVSQTPLPQRRFRSSGRERVASDRCNGRVAADLAGTLIDHRGPCQWVALKDGHMELIDFDTVRPVPTDYAVARYTQTIFPLLRGKPRRTGGCGGI
jgi:hypothetical protein